MNSQTVNILLLIGLIFQSGCDITFKRKSIDHKMAQNEVSQSDLSQSNGTENIEATENSSIIDRDMKIINSFYADPANKVISKEMRKHGKVTKKQEKQLVVGKTIPENIQVVPLPLELERILSPLPLHLIRVQACMKVIVMDVKSRQIVTALKIKY